MCRARGIKHRPAKSTRIKIAIAVVVAALSFNLQAETLTVGLLIGSKHIGVTEFYCNNGYRKLNGSNPGLMLGYNGYFIGRYENSYSGCNGIKYSNIIGKEWEGWRWGDLDISFTTAISDGYPDDHSVNGYVPWLTINAKYSIVKVGFGFGVIATGLEFEF